MLKIIYILSLKKSTFLAGGGSPQIGHMSPKNRFFLDARPPP